jgi:hypothetical protein
MDPTTLPDLTYGHGNYRFRYYAHSGGVVVEQYGTPIDAGYVTDTISPFTMTDLKRWAARWAVNNRALRRRIRAIQRAKAERGVRA